MDERLSRPGWLTHSRRFTHISGHPSATGRAHDRESSPVKDQCSNFYHYCATQPTVVGGSWTRRTIQSSRRRLGYGYGCCCCCFIKVSDSDCGAASISSNKHYTISRPLIVKDTRGLCMVPPPIPPPRKIVSPDKTLLLGQKQCIFVPRLFRPSSQETP